MEDLINALAKGVLAVIIIFPITLVINRLNKKKKQKRPEFFISGLFLSNLD